MACAAARAPFVRPLRIRVLSRNLQCVCGYQGHGLAVNQGTTADPGAFESWRSCVRRAFRARCCGAPAADPTRPGPDTDGPPPPAPPPPALQGQRSPRLNVIASPVRKDGLIPGSPRNSAGTGRKPALVPRSPSRMACAAARAPFVRPLRIRVLSRNLQCVCGYQGHGLAVNQGTTADPGAFESWRSCVRRAFRARCCGAPAADPTRPGPDTDGPPRPVPRPGGGTAARARRGGGADRSGLTRGARLRHDSHPCKSRIRGPGTSALLLHVPRRPKGCRTDSPA